MQYARDMKAKAQSNLSKGASEETEIINGILDSIYGYILEDVDLRGRLMTLNIEVKMYSYAVQCALREAGYEVEFINPLEFEVKW